MHRKKDQETRRIMVLPLPGSRAGALAGAGGPQAGRLDKGTVTFSTMAPCRVLPVASEGRMYRWAVPYTGQGARWVSVGKRPGERHVSAWCK